MIHSSQYPEDSLIYRLLKRAEIRQQISSRKSVQEGRADRISELLIEAANELDNYERRMQLKQKTYTTVKT